MIDQTRSGGVTINDVMVHVAQDDLPFGQEQRQQWYWFLSRQGRL